MSTCSGDKHDLWAVTTSPAVLNTRSMPPMWLRCKGAFLANIDNNGKVCKCTFQFNGIILSYLNDYFIVHFSFYWFSWFYIVTKTSPKIHLNHLSFSSWKVQLSLYQSLNLPELWVSVWSIVASSRNVRSRGGLPKGGFSGFSTCTYGMI